MPMETDPAKINDPDRDDFDAQIESTILKQGQDYAARNARSKTENKGRAESRAKIKGLGMDANAFATATRLIKDKTPEELKAWRRDFDLTIKIMGSKQRELFPEEQLRAEKRAQVKADKAAGKPRTAAELDAKTDTDPNSDPKNGGAQVDLEDAIKAQQARELAEGAALLEGKSDDWRAGFNAFSAGAARDVTQANVSIIADWLAGWDAATQHAFESAALQPSEPAPAAKPVEPTPPDPKPKKQSQSAKAAAIAAAVQGRTH